ncbi:MAG: hypothetical protein OEV58_16425, partial [Gammaproteobacteria bacterium]|nr:hypothetical protein [Gammaproteobacteria bacterium]
MLYFKRILIAGFLLLVAVDAAAVYTVNGVRKSFDISRTTTAPIIDGKLDDEVWRTAKAIDDFHQTSPTDGASPS